MPAPSPDLIVANPPALNSYQRFPFFIDEFPADTLLGGTLSERQPGEEPVDPPRDTARREVR